MLTQITCSDCGVCCRVYVAFKPYFSCLRQLLLVEFGGSPQIPLNWLTLSTPLQNGTAIFTYNCGVLKEHFPSAGTRDTECQQQNPQQFESVFCPWLRALKVKNVQFFPLFPTLIYPRDPGHSATLSVTGGRGQITTASAFYCRSPTASGPIIVQPVVRNDSVARIQNTYI